MEIVPLILVVVAVLAVGAVLFCLWVVVGIARAFGRLAAWAIWPKRKAVRFVGPQACHNPDCRGDNPEHARFCRRCGRPLPALMRFVDARAA